MLRTTDQTSLRCRWTRRVDDQSLSGAASARKSRAQEHAVAVIPGDSHATHNTTERRCEDRNIARPSRRVNRRRRIAHRQHWHWRIRTQPLRIATERLIEHEVADDEESEGGP